MIFEEGRSMSMSFKNYRKNARIATRHLLAHHGKDFVNYYVGKINATTNEVQVSMVLAEVRQAI